MNIRNIGLYLAALFTGASLLAGCATTPQPTATTSDAAPPAASAIASADAGADDKLQVCLTGYYRPFSYGESADELEGIDVALMKDFAQRQNIEIEWVMTTWSDLMPDFLSSCDIAVGGISVTDERAKQVTFSDPVIFGGKAAITMCGREKEFDTIEEINESDNAVITPIGGTNEKFADENFPDAEIIRYEDNNTIFEQIVAGKADLMISDSPEIVWAANEHEGLCQVNADSPFTEAELAYMLQQDDPELTRKVNAWLAEIATDGTWDRAIEPWFGEDSVYESNDSQG